MTEHEIPASEDAVMRRKPRHPGRIIAEGCIGPDAVGNGGAANVSEAARRLGIARHTLSRIIHGHAAITPSLAVRLEAEGWGTAEGWLHRQARWDIAREREKLAA